jgi:hypothetical protein
MPIAGRRNAPKNIYSRRTEEEKLKAQKAIDNHKIPLFLKGSSELTDIILEKNKTIQKLMSDKRNYIEENQSLKKKYDILKSLSKKIPFENKRHFENEGVIDDFNTNSWADIMDYDVLNRNLSPTFSKPSSPVTQPINQGYDSSETKREMDDFLKGIEGGNISRRNNRSPNRNNRKTRRNNRSPRRNNRKTRINNRSTRRNIRKTRRNNRTPRRNNRSTRRNIRKRK